MHPIRAAVVVSCVLASCAALGGSPAYAVDAAWSAASGQLPTQATPPWLYYQEPTSAVALDPSAGVLRLETVGDGARASYFQEYDHLAVPEELVVEARVRFVSGSSRVAGRAPAGIYLYPRKGIANYLWIGADEVFVNAGSRFDRGQTASVDTDGAFHDYRVEVHGTADGSRLDVFYDGTPLLSGTLFEDDEDQDPEIAWGDIAYEASGVSEWQSFRHNAAVPEPGGVLALAVVGCVGMARRGGRGRES